MKVLIIDDEPLARMIVREYLQSYPKMVVLQECADGFEGVKAINQWQPQLIFLDIQMPKINGFEMLELIDQAPSIIFTTAYDEYAIKAFETNAIDYLLKPFSKERFDKAMTKLLQQNPTTQQKQQIAEQAIQVAAVPQQRIVVKDGSKIKIIPHASIHYIEAADDYVKIITADGQFLKKKTMSSFEAQLDSQLFSRVHRSYLINTQYINRLEVYEKDNHLALLTSGAKIPVSKSGYTKLREVLGL